MLRKLVLNVPKWNGFLPPPRCHTGTFTCGSGDYDGHPTPGKLTLQWAQAPAQPSTQTLGTRRHQRCFLSSQQKSSQDPLLSGLVKKQAVLEPTFIVLAALPLDSGSQSCCAIYTYTRMYTHGEAPPPTPAAPTSRACQDCKDAALANSTGGRFTTKLTKQAGQSWSQGLTAENVRKECGQPLPHAHPHCPWEMHQDDSQKGQTGPAPPRARWLAAPCGLLRHRPPPRTSRMKTPPALTTAALTSSSARSQRCGCTDGRDSGGEAHPRVEMSKAV